MDVKNNSNPIGVFHFEKGMRKRGQALKGKEQMPGEPPFKNSYSLLFGLPRSAVPLLEDRRDDRRLRVKHLCVYLC